MVPYSGPYAGYAPYMRQQMQEQNAVPTTASSFTGSPSSSGSTFS